MDLTTFLKQRRPAWTRLEALLEIVEGSGMSALDKNQAVEFASLFRRTAADLNQAQTILTGDTVAQYLNGLVARCHMLIYAKSRSNIRLSGILRALVRYVKTYPVVFRRYLGHFLIATLVFFGSSAYAFVASYFDPEAARSYLLPADFPMIQPEKVDDQSQGVMSTGQLAAFSGFLFRHNLSVTLVAFALGLTFGIGTIWLLVESGVVMGALAAVFVEAGQLQQFCTGILPHGVLEIPAILLGGAGGLMLAQGVIRARPWPRLVELARIGKEALYLVSGAVPLLAVAAVLEGGVARAPNRMLDDGLKLAVAGVFAVMFLGYLLLVGWKIKVAPHASPP